MRGEGLFPLESLAERAAEALASAALDQPSARVREIPDRRTIRYYTTLGLLDRPASFRGRTALYGRRHLLQLVAIKRLQAEGLPLSEIQRRLFGLPEAELSRIAGLPEAALPAPQQAKKPRAAFWREVADLTPPAPLSREERGEDLTPSASAGASSSPLSRWERGDTGGEVPSELPIVRGARVTAEQLERARQFRRAPTPAESKAWELLRDRQRFGLKFRRQQPIYGFIADFYCDELRLALEIDGGVHDDPAQAEHDELRAAIFRSLGLRVLRLRNEEVNEEALELLLAPLLPEPTLVPRERGAPAEQAGGEVTALRLAPGLLVVLEGRSLDAAARDALRAAAAPLLAFLDSLDTDQGGRR